MNGKRKARRTSLPPSPDRECRKVGKYEVCFYPGFVRRLSLADEDGRETVAYEQEQEREKVFVLPPGQSKPWPTHTVEVRGAGGAPVLTLQVNDPGQRIDRLEVVLKPARGKGRGERLIIEDGPVLCPPLCPDPEGE